MESIVCPHCGKKLELTEALKHEVEEKITAELKVSQEKEITKIRLETEETVKKRLEQDLNFKIKNFENENDELRKRNKDFQEQLLELNKQVRELLDQNEKAKLANEKALTEQIEKIKQTENERAKLEKLELQKKLDDTLKALEEAQRKTQQGSQQLQGEVLELDLEKQLKLIFPEDEILPVAKGIRGADLLQKVRNRVGKTAGIIIWEAKRAKWSEGWIPKLKDDMISAKANEAILVVEELPEKISHSGYLNGVWVTSYKDALTVSNSVRILLKKIAQTKAAEENKDEKLEELYQFINSDNFKHRINAYLENIVGMKDDLETEKRVQEKIWKKKEIRIARLEKINNVFDEIQAIAGVDMPLLTRGEDEIEEETEELKLIN